jgi:hypothetical protein
MWDALQEMRNSHEILVLNPQGEGQFDWRTEPAPAEICFILSVF